MAKAVILILDGLGVGELPDAAEYKDKGSNTLGNLASAVGGLSLPCLERLGLGNIGDLKGLKKVVVPVASYGKMKEISKGKDTITGHWEMTGIINLKPFPTYPEGFPDEVITSFEQRIGRKTLCNRPASGTEIIKELGDEHVRTGYPIVYTSADSVFQIAAHEDVIPVEGLYGMCRAAREMLVPPHNVCRVIARPFIGPPYERTYRRKDFPLPPPEETVLDLMLKKNLDVVSVGKVSDMFAGIGFSHGIKATGNKDIMQRTEEAFRKTKEGLIFANLVDFDTLYGHRNDTEGYYKALREFDSWLSGFLSLLRDGDYLFITADHGNDPTTPSTDHSREYAPVLFYNKKLPPKALGVRESFCDIGATVAGIFGIDFDKGKSFIV